MDNKEITEEKKGKQTKVLNKVVAFGKKTTEEISKNVKVLSGKAKEKNYERRLKKYNPLFEEEYFSESFKLPNMVIIVDDAVRRGIDVCEGAIGWRQNNNGMEVLYLYDEAIELSGLNFIPAPSCDTAYYVDTFDRNRYIKLDCVFGKAHEEKLAELEHIAYKLGAKSCTIELVESSSQDESESKSMLGKGKGIGNVSASISGNSVNKDQRSGRTTTYFEGNNAPSYPQLKWFANDNNILGLIEMRCSGNNSIKTKTLELSGASSATMSQTAAYGIDSAVAKVKGGASMSMSKQAKKELQSKLIFIVEF